jgi:hypothetical protein
LISRGDGLAPSRAAPGSAPQALPDQIPAA